jgi:hypothetical protein
METAKQDGIIDYAMPMMQALNSIKAAHNAVLEKSFDAAIEQAFVALAETKLMLNALKEMRELYK